MNVVVIEEDSKFAEKVSPVLLTSILTSIRTSLDTPWTVSMPLALTFCLPRLPRGSMILGKGSFRKNVRFHVVLKKMFFLEWVIKAFKKFHIGLKGELLAFDIQYP